MIRTHYILTGMKSRRNPELSKHEILESAFRVIHRKGFKAASVNDILAGTGLTKGAFYHHFSSKNAVCDAIMDGVAQAIQEMWSVPLDGQDDPVSGLQDILVAYARDMDDESVNLGCPLNNLAQELSPTDERFRKRTMEIYDGWRSIIADALRRGQRAGTVNPAVDPHSTATYFVAALTGGRGMAKNAQSKDILIACADHLGRYLETLRA